ncbi:MAG: hypothetical protein M5U16_01415 [Hyphomicrobium sp.]|nr:hypothetical protein [Hyphomicrobium sp.]
MSDLVRAAYRDPALLVRSTRAIEDMICGLSADLGLSAREVGALVLRMPTLASMRAATVVSNVTTLAGLLGVDVTDAARCALRMPQLLYLRPDGVAGKLRVVSEKLSIPLPEVAAAVLRMPTLAGRDPAAVAHKVRLCVRISAALGRDASPGDILKGQPAVTTYGMDRLLLRWLAAKIGIWTGGWTSLVIMSDRKLLARFEEHYESLGPQSREAARLRALVSRRMRADVRP